MITRRSFLAALAALPVIGKWMPQNGWTRSWPDAKPFSASTLLKEPIHAPAGSALFERYLAELIEKTPPRLIDDSYAKTMANIVDEAAARATYEELTGSPLQFAAWGPSPNIHGYPKP